MPGLGLGTCSPDGAVPMQDQALAARDRPSRAHRPGIVCGRCGHAAEGAAWGIRRGNLLPFGTVPVQDQGSGTAPVAGGAAADRPGVAGGPRGHSQELGSGSGARARHLLPCRAVPVQDQGLVAAVRADGPGVAGRGGGHAGEKAGRGERRRVGRAGRRPCCGRCGHHSGNQDHQQQRHENQSHGTCSELVRAHGLPPPSWSACPTDRSPNGKRLAPACTTYVISCS